MRKLAFCLVALTVVANRAQAQSEEGSELSLLGGVLGSGHGFVGASTGLAFSKYVIGLLDFSYARLGAETLHSYNPERRVEGSSLYDFNASAHIRFPINGKWVPYGILGPSAVWSGYHYATVGPNGARKVVYKENLNFGFHTGAGLRYHVNQTWGIRPEVRVVITNQTVLVFSLGMFFRVDSLNKL